MLESHERHRVTERSALTWNSVEIVCNKCRADYFRGQSGQSVFKTKSLYSETRTTKIVHKTPFSSLNKTNCQFDKLVDQVGKAPVDSDSPGRISGKSPDRHALTNVLQENKVCKFGKVKRNVEKYGILINML